MKNIPTTVFTYATTCQYSQRQPSRQTDTLSTRKRRAHRPEIKFANVFSLNLRTIVTPTKQEAQ